jgi:hypothetical protein
MDLSTFKADPTKQDGTWIEYGDARFLIASAHSPAYKKALRARVGKIPQHLLKSQPALAEKAATDVMAKHVLLDWEGVTENGKPLESTPEARRAALDIPAFGDWVAEQALNLANFQAEGDADDVAALKSVPDVGA